jgi:hypothetical protein
MSGRSRLVLGVVAVIPLAAAAGGAALAMQGNNGTHPAMKEDKLPRTGPTCPERGREGLNKCAERADTEDQATQATRGDVTVDKLQIGDCVNDLLYPDARVVPCATAHQEEIVAMLVGPEGPYPGAELLVDTFAPECEARAARYVGDEPRSEELFVKPEVPFGTVDWDAYGRTIICAVSSILKEPLAKSVRH